jgi:MFS transporter, CP family, cyanate transporter
MRLSYTMALNSVSTANQSPAVTVVPAPLFAAESPYRWVMLALLWCCYCAFGMISSSSAPLVSAIMPDLGIDATAMGFVLGTWQLVYIGMAFWCGALIDRVGLRRALGAGLLLLALSAGLRAVAWNFASLAFAVGLFGIGGPMISIGSSKLVASWFGGRQRGIAIGIANTGPAVGSVMILAAANSVLVPLTGSWRGAVLAPGLAALAMFVLWLLLARNVPRVEATVLETAHPRLFHTMRELLRIRNVRVLMVGAAAAFAVNHGINNWLPKMLEAKSLSAADAGVFASVTVLAGIVSTLLVPRLAIAGRRRALLLSVFAGQCVTLVGLWLLGGGVLLASLPMLGFFQAAVVPLVMLCLMETPEVGARHIGVIGGMYFALAEIGGFGGPFVLGYLFNASGAFTSGVWFLIGLTVFLILLSWAFDERGERTSRTKPALSEVEGTQR